MGGKVMATGSFIHQQLPLRDLAGPEGDTVHLWYLDFQSLSNPLNADEKVDFRQLSAFQQRTNRRFYLRLLLGAYLGLPGKDVIINRRIKGRPELDSSQSGGNLDFSVARSGSAYLVGISNGATIGVDLEDADRRAGKPLALAERYFSDAETSELNRVPGGRLQEAFMRTWSCKEAMVKASGLGIANQLCRFTVEVNPDRPPALLAMPNNDECEWSLSIVRPDETKIAAVAVRQPRLNVQGFILR
jgi:4'-phosphopantetheinyl transferase